MTTAAADPGLVRSLLLRQVTWQAQGVLSLQLVDPDGADLPEWEAGAHLELLLPSGLIRQYSLCGDPADRRSYTVAVLEEQAGRGGSREVHAGALAGSTVRVRGPRNHFPLVPAERAQLRHEGHRGSGAAAVQHGPRQAP
jgi:ferredoxin-NADP reductase